MSAFGRFKPAGKKPRHFGPKPEAKPAVDHDALSKQLELVLGPLSPSQLAMLLPLAEKSLDVAVNAFFSTEQPKNHIEDSLFVDEKPMPPPQPQADVWPRHLGTFQTALWVTRSGRTPHFGDILTLKRVPTKSKKDFIVRVLLGDENGPELARVAEADAEMVAPLLDAQLAQFQGSVVFCDLPLRTGDSVYAQFDVLLCQDAFTKPIINAKVDPRASKLQEDEESVSERLMTLRQTSLNLLFTRLGLVDDQGKQKGTNTELREVTKNQLDMVYENSVKAELLEMEPPESFAFELYPYQKKALYWMSQRESDAGDFDTTLHPLWTQLKWPNGGSFFANLSSGELSLEKVSMVTAGVGGILADEMGLGKTVQILSLVHSVRPKKGITLIVAPMSLLNQWEQEALKSANDQKCMNVLIYYGASGKLMPSATTLSQPKITVVITSYGVLASEYKAHMDAPGSSTLFATSFDRVVLDEAHIIKNKNTIAAKAATSLKANKRWAVTGTPVVNRLEDLYSLLRFLRIEPWNNFSFWSAFITKPFERGEAEMALKTVQSIVDPICLRRTKDMKHNGKPLVVLPEKTVLIKKLAFTQAEQDLYSFMFGRVRGSLTSSLQNGTATKKMASLLFQILRLRQICCHPLLIRKVKSPDKSLAETLTDGVPESAPEGVLTAAVEEAPEAENELHSPELEALLEHFYHVPQPETRLLDSYGTQVVKAVLEAAEQPECAICFEPIAPTKQAFTPCYHLACIDCILQFIDHAEKQQSQLKCPICRTNIDKKDLLIVDKINGKIVLREYVENHQSTKVRALVQELRTNPGNGKNVVFSQFTSFLDLLEPQLEYFGLKVLKVDGRLNMETRNCFLEEFKTTTKDCVLLLSLKVGGVGLNLTCANQVFMMDPWWNFAIESQAIDRIHRMGQTSTTRIVRFIIEGSIEERILSIQDRKQALSKVVSSDEKKSNTVEDLKLLFDIAEFERQ